jgi:hypothetical protein
MNIVLALLLLLFPLTSTLHAAPIPVDIKKIVTFIYYSNNPTNASPDGTGFLVIVPATNNTNISFGYLVTAKHVLKPSTNSWLHNIIVRLNRRDGTSDMVSIPLRTAGPVENVFIHDDPTVDIAIICFSPRVEMYDVLYLPLDVIASESDFKNLDIHEGTDVFFTGMFANHLGDKQNTPITRFGKVALITNDKIDWVFGKTDLYLVEANAYPGNSGSPVFFHVGAERGNGNIVLGLPTLKLAGVLSGGYRDIEPIQTVSVSTNQYVTPNLGITGVVPSYELKEILFSKELQHQRDEFK